MEIINRLWTLLFFIWLLHNSFVIASWNTLYSYEDGNIYIHLKNNDLIQLNFSITGFNNLQFSDYNESELNIADNQQVATLPTPPSNSTLFLLNKNLYAIHNDNAIIAEGGKLSLSKFISNSWVKVSLDFSNVAGDTSNYNYPTVLTIPGNNETVYIYGGINQDSSVITNRLLSIDINTMKVANVSTATKPQAFYGASNVLAPNSKIQLVIGGQSDVGWLNMYQLASWDFLAGWSFFQVDSDPQVNVTLNSRKFALTLPIFNPLPNNTGSTINSLLQINEVFLIGGQHDKGLSFPTYAKLDMKTNDWIWNTTLNVNIDESQILGAAMIFNTLVVVNSSSVIQKRDGGKSYSLNLFDINTFSPVQNLKTNVKTILQTPMAGGTNKQSVQLKAILGTLIPLIVLAVGGSIGFHIYKQKQGKQNENEDIDYQFGAFENGSMLSFHTPNGPPTREIKPYIENDSNNTLDAVSLDSWVKKRQLFDKDRFGRTSNSFDNSNETLSDSATISDTSDLRMKPTPKLQLLPGGQKLQIQTSPKLVDRSVTKIKKSVSPRQSLPNIASPFLTGTSIPTIKEHRVLEVIRNGTLKYDDNQLGDSPFADQDSVDITNFDDSSDSDIDDRMDVQFLVSSKRRSVLKVVNPDPGRIEEDGADDGDEAFEDDRLIQDSTNDEFGGANDLNGRQTSVRQRVASGNKLLLES